MTNVAPGSSRRIWLTVVLALGFPAVAGSASAQALVPLGARQLVMPFENSTREPRGYWLSEGSAVLLTDGLNALGAQAITRDARLSAFEQLRVPSVATLSHATVIRIGQVVGAAQVVIGSFELRGDELIVHARAIRLDTGRLFPEIVERGALSQIFGVYSRIARRLLPDSRVTPQQMEQVFPPLAAFEQYIKGVLAETPVTQVSFLTEALRLAPDFARPRFALWAVHTDQGAHRQALEVIRRVPDGQPQARRARFLGAISLINLAEYQQAFEALTALNRDRDEAAVFNNLGIVQLRRPAGASTDRPIWYFAQAARAEPRDPDLFFNLGYASWLERDTQGAITALREAVRRNPADDAAHYVLGVALQAAGNSAEAAREKELARQLSSTYAQWEAKQGGANTVPRGLERLKTTLDGDALRVDDIVVATGQRDQRELAEFHLAAGRRLLDAQRDAEAIAELRRAIFLAPYQSDAHLLLGRAYLHGGRLDDAIDALKISIWSTDTTAAHLALADAYTQSGKTADARTELQKVIAVDPTNAEARRLLGSLPP